MGTLTVCSVGQTYPEGLLADCSPPSLPPQIFEFSSKRTDLAGGLRRQETFALSVFALCRSLLWRGANLVLKALNPLSANSIWNPVAGDNRERFTAWKWENFSWSCFVISLELTAHQLVYGNCLNELFCLHSVLQVNGVIFSWGKGEDGWCRPTGSSCSNSRLSTVVAF